MKKKITLIVVSVLLIISLIVGMSYAYWRLTYTATKVNKIVSSCFSMELTNEKNNIVLDDAYPISDEKGKSLTPYSFTVTNTCDLFASYTINLEMLEGTTLNSKYVKTMINSEAITNLSTLEIIDPSIEGATESRILFTGSLGSGDSTDYTLRIWMDSETPYNEDSMNKIFQAKITVTAEVSTYSPVENGFTNLAEALLVNEYQTTSVDIAKNKIASKQAVDFSKTAPLITWNKNIPSNTYKISFTKADPALIGQYGIVQKSTTILFAKSYEFDTTSGYYSLTDTQHYNPEEVDFSSDDYYLCNSYININSSGMISSTNNVSCTGLKRIIELESVEYGTLKLPSGETITTKIYNFKYQSHNQIEIESDKSDKGLYIAEDDYGTTYYYRGNVSNNYVKFSNYYWRVLRINGDGSIRLLYAGSDSNSSGDKLRIAAGAYSDYRDNPTYGGYMYSNVINTSYLDTIRNDNDSAIKTKLDNWYKTNILDEGYSSYIADSGFCNDRSLLANSPGDGSSNANEVRFASWDRIVNHTPTYKCANASNDLFTLPGNVNGNNALIYPIGTITADELAYAGLSRGSLNKLVFTYMSYSMWTMTPYAYSATQNLTSVWTAYSDGAISMNQVNASQSIRPVINLKSTTEITGGIGTKNDPFIIK